MLPHVIHLALDQVSALAFNTFDELLRMRRVTYALEELDTLLALKLLQATILLDELLFICRQLHTLQIVKNVLLGLPIRINRLQTSQANRARNVIKDGLGG